GKVSAVLGTHTHIQTADEAILKNGTAYITDVGMTGAHDSVIGNRVEEVLERFIRGVPRKLEVATEDVRISYVVVTIDNSKGVALNIERFCEKLGGEDYEIAS
ncbi:MAG: YmdB family metallophosphoesterase, partial [Hydrogenothermaceae bacterium]|nr:YmdB family metallophosphoesterase [Hydrogenothermaceae bacterium]